MIVDSHIHCADPAEFRRFVLPGLREAGIGAVCVFPPVEDVYDRYDPGFVDSPSWRERRRQANRTAASMARETGGVRVFPYYFVWNDFDVEELKSGLYRGVKWHRHPDEPQYRYGTEACARFLAAVEAMKLPVLLEETISNTLLFLSKTSDMPVIIPHMGMLNGGYRALEAEGVWGEPRVYADSALAPVRTIEAFLDRYGSGRLLFGSDYPFGSPPAELRKLQALGLAPQERDAVLGGNLLKLLHLPA